MKKKGGGEESIRKGERYSARWYGTNTDIYNLKLADEKLRQTKTEEGRRRGGRGEEKRGKRGRKDEAESSSDRLHTCLTLIFYHF